MLGGVRALLLVVLLGTAPETYLEKAREARQEGRLEVAEQLYRSAAVETPSEITIHLELAAVIDAQGRSAEAAALFLRIGQGLSEAQRWEEAVAPLQEAVRLNEKNSLSWSLLGRALAESRRFDAARQALLRAVSLGEGGLGPLLALAAAHWETQRFDEADALYRKVLERYPDHGLVLYQYGQFLVFVGRVADARGFLEKAAEQRSDHANLFFFLGRTRAADGDRNGARIAFQRALDLGHDEAGYALERLDVAVEQKSSNAPVTGAAIVELTPAARQVGIDFRHDNGKTFERHLPETMGSGLAWLDFDGDGWLDLYLVQSAGKNRLWRGTGQQHTSGQDSVEKSFEEWTARSGADDDAYGQGAVAADLNGDGAIDLYLANFGPDVYLENQGNGTFVDRTVEAGLGLGGWSSTAAVADADLDGDLDLYVVRYLDYDPATAPACTTGGRQARPEESRDYCNVIFFAGAADIYYRQDDVGVFREATADVGLTENTGRGLGAVWVDIDGTGAPELYVANDLDENRLWRFEEGIFEDVGRLSGAALNEVGEAEASMGVALGDIDGDGDADLAVTHFDTETNTLYSNLESMVLADVSAASGFGLPSYGLLGFGVTLSDLNGDGDLDVYVANGHVFEQPRRDTVDHAQRDLLLLGDGAGFFEEASEALESHPRGVGRGVAAADYDNDGDVDLGIQSNGGVFELLRNDRRPGPWLGVELRGLGSNTGAVGARVELLTSARRQVRWVTVGSSYQSSEDGRVLFAWAEGEEAISLEVRWPSGAMSRLMTLPSQTYLRLYEKSPPR